MLLCSQACWLVSWRKKHQKRRLLWLSFSLLPGQQTAVGWLALAVFEKRKRRHSREEKTTDIRQHVFKKGRRTTMALWRGDWRVHIILCPGEINIWKERSRERQGGKKRKKNPKFSFWKCKAIIIDIFLNMHNKHNTKMFQTKPIRLIRQQPK